MTENEAIRELEWAKSRLMRCSHMNANRMHAFFMAIKALEEVQQYRKHGVTVESALDNMCDLAAAENLIEEYRAIGTPEECLQNKDFLDFLSDKMNPNDFETYLRLYNALEEKGCEE